MPSNPKQLCHVTSASTASGSSIYDTFDDEKRVI